MPSLFRSLRLAALALAAVLAAGTAQAQLLDTALSYQGRLTDNGAAANGDFDFRFTLLDSDGEPSTILAGPLEFGSVAVAEGLFTLDLDFGQGAFAGEEAWLQIEVKPSGSPEAYTPLSPRQRVAPSSVALLALDAATLGGLAPAEFVGPEGPQGPEGPEGPEGPQGPSGTSVNGPTTVLVIEGKDGVTHEIVFTSGVLTDYRTY